MNKDVGGKVPCIGCEFLISKSKPLHSANHPEISVYKCDFCADSGLRITLTHKGKLHAAFIEMARTALREF